MAATEPQSILSQIHQQQQTTPLSILTLAEPLLNQQQSPSTSTQRESNASSSDPAAQPDLRPSSLQADLQHYRDLFSKLRFSYSEQVTKERYLKSIVGDPPTLHTAEENALLQEKVARMKAELKAKKVEVEEMVEEIRGEARELARKWEDVENGKRVLEVVPGEVQELEAEVGHLREKVERRQAELGRDAGEEPRYTMSLDATNAALEERRTENELMEREIGRLKEAIEVKDRECERTERELEECERKRNEVTRVARDLKQIKEEGGRDMVGERGRWYAAQGTVMKGLLEV